MNKIKLLLIALLLGSTSALLAQTVTGTVSSADGPLPGATVLIKGTAIGTSTDFDGNFSIEASNGLFNNSGKTDIISKRIVQRCNL